jgi:transcriptional regulator with PAS, ATPase and Fis domain
VPRTLRPETEWLILPGKTLAEIETAAIRSSFIRHNGNRRKMLNELQCARSTLYRKLAKLGLRRRRDGRRLIETDLARAFYKHCESIAAELNIYDSTLLKWINKHAPFGVEDK